MSHALKTFLSSTYYRAEFGRSSSDCAGVGKEENRSDGATRRLKRIDDMCICLDTNNKMTDRRTDTV